MGVCLGPTDRNVKATVNDGHQLNVFGIYDCQFEMQNQGLRAQVIVARLPEKHLVSGPRLVNSYGNQVKSLMTGHSLLVDKTRLCSKLTELSRMLRVNSLVIDSKAATSLIITRLFPLIF